MDVSGSNYTNYQRVAVHSALADIQIRWLTCRMPESSALKVSSCIIENHSTKYSAHQDIYSYLLILAIAPPTSLRISDRKFSIPQSV